MTRPSSTKPALARRILRSPPLRVLVLGFLLPVMIGLNFDVMTSYAAQPVKAVQHIIAPVMAEHRLPPGLELHPVSHLLEHRLGQRSQGRPDPVHRQGPRPADRGPVRRRILGAGAGSVHHDGHRDAGDGGAARKDRAAGLEAPPLRQARRHKQGHNAGTYCNRTRKTP
jgi:hypothetical protein